MPGSSPAGAQLLLALLVALAAWAPGPLAEDWCAGAAGRSVARLLFYAYSVFGPRLVCGAGRICLAPRINWPSPVAASRRRPVRSIRWCRRRPGVHGRAAAPDHAALDLIGYPWRRWLKLLLNPFLLPGSWACNCSCQRMAAGRDIEFTAPQWQMRDRDRSRAMRQPTTMPHS
jgi:hypothetical protein